MNNPDAIPALPAGLPDDWVLDRDLRCPKCEYNLRGLRAPRCPECGITFCWQALLFVECARCGAALHDEDGPKCGVCGLKLDWAALLADAHPRQARQFEFTATPLRAAVRVLFAALSPLGFWRRIELESPPNTRRLTRLALFCATVCVVALSAAFLIAPNQFGRSRFGDALAMSLLVFSLLPLTALALPRFTPTLAAFRIRRDQLARGWAYATIGWFWIGIVFTFAATVMYWYNPFAVRAGWMRSQLFFEHQYITTFLPFVRLGSADSPRWWLWRQDDLMSFNVCAFAALGLFAFVWWWWFLYVFLHTYLRLNRRNAVALLVCTQALGMIVMGFAILFIAPLRVLWIHLR